MAGRIAFLAVASCLLLTRPTATAQATHPTVQFAADLLKQGQIDEALSALKSRVDADPTDCKAIGLVAVGHLQQRDLKRAQPWVDRLVSLPLCGAARGIASKMIAEVGAKEELIKTTAALVPAGDVHGIEQRISEAEKTLGPLIAVRAYIDALKGKFPLLDNQAAQSSVPALLTYALKQRKAALEKATNNLLGSYISDWSHKPLDTLEPNARVVWESDGYRAGHALALNAAGNARNGSNVMANYQRLFAWHADQVRKGYELVPLDAGWLGDMMTLAFLSGSSAQIESLAAISKRSSNKITWSTSFHGKDSWQYWGSVTVDFESSTVSYNPGWGLGNTSKATKDVTTPWSLPLSQIRQIDQVNVKFGNLKAGYRALRPGSMGAVINGRWMLPLPAQMEVVAFAYGEAAARQAIREYGAQVARLVGLPQTSVKLIGEKSGGAFSFMQLWTAGSMAFSEATGNAAMTQFWSAQLAQANSDAAARRQLDAAGADSWEGLKKDAILVQALTVEGVNAEIDRLLR